VPSVPAWLISLRLRCAIRRAPHLLSATTHAILAAMHRSDTPTRWSLASLLLILILILPVLNVHAAGAPTDAETPISPTPISPSSLPGIGYYYTVQPTDTLWDIAVAHGISVETLFAANSQIDPKRLLAGQTIFVPAQPAVVPRKPTPAPPVARAPISTPLPETAAAPAQEAGQTPAPADAPPPEPAPVDTVTATPEPAPTVEEVAPGPSGWQAEMLELINGKRIAQGLAALTWSPELARAAQAHAEDCAQLNRGSHVGSDGANLAARLARIGYEARTSSENWANALSVQRTFGMWWNEPKGRDPHRRNILNSRFTEIGIGVARGSWGYYFISDFGG
jgi:uncharacterized protein YkwD